MQFSSIRRRVKTRWLKLKASTWDSSSSGSNRQEATADNQTAATVTFFFVFLLQLRLVRGAGAMDVLGSFSKRLWFVTIVQYINQSWIYCEKWNLLATTSTPTSTTNNLAWVKVKHHLLHCGSRYVCSSVCLSVSLLLCLAAGSWSCEWRCVWVA